MNNQFSVKYATDKLCVIISQEKGRPGSEHDRARLKELFINLRFDVELIINPTIENFEMKQKKIKEKCEKGDIGLLVVFVLSHGLDDKVEICPGVKTENDKVEGQDGLYIDIGKIILNFTVENMKTKPKLFFFQACKGKNLEKGTKSVDVDAVRAVNENESDDDEGLHEAPSELDFSKLPLDYDTLVSYASIPGCKAFRSEEWGTIFIYLIYQVFIAHAAKLDVISMLTLVSRLIATKLMLTAGGEDAIMQMPSFKSKLTKKVFLTNNEFPLKYGPLFHKGDSTDYEQEEDNEKKRLHGLAWLLQLKENDLLPDSLDYPAKNGSGLCLVFAKSRNTQYERIGSNKDVENLEKLFTITLGYAEENVRIYSDKRKKEILETIENVTADKSLMTRITNFIVIMLTHGDDDKIWAQDQQFAVDNLVLPLKQCDKIMEIPKFFLIQAEGLNLNKTLEYRNNGEDNRIAQFKFHDGKHLPSEANMLFMYSNVPASSEGGTPLIKHFCETVKAGYLNNDLLSILTVVNRKIAEEIMSVSSVSIDKGEKMPFFESRLIGNLMLGAWKKSIVDLNELNIELN